MGGVSETGDGRFGNKSLLANDTYRYFGTLSQKTNQNRGSWFWQKLVCKHPPWASSHQVQALELIEYVCNDKTYPSLHFDFILISLILCNQLANCGRISSISSIHTDRRTIDIR